MARAVGPTSHQSGWAAGAGALRMSAAAHSKRRQRPPHTENRGLRTNRAVEGCRQQALADQTAIAYPHAAPARMVRGRLTLVATNGMCQSRGDCCDGVVIGPMVRPMSGGTDGTLVVAGVQPSRQQGSNGIDDQDHRTNAALSAQRCWCLPHSDQDRGSPAQAQL